MSYLVDRVTVGGASPTILGQILDHVETVDAQIIQKSGSSQPFVTAQAVGRIASSVAFTTAQVKAALSLIETSQLGVPLTTTNKMEYYWKKTNELVYTDAQKKGTVSNGYLKPLTINFKAAVPSTIGMHCIPLSLDGITNPIVHSDTALLTAADTNPGECWQLSNIELSGLVSDLMPEDATLGFGIVDRIKFKKTYAYKYEILKQVPFLAIPTDDERLHGLVKSANDFGFYPFTSANPVVITADNTAEGSVRGAAQMTATVNAGIIKSVTLTGRDGEPVAQALAVLPQFDGINYPIIFSY